MIKAILFDLDGVLVNATEWHYEALNKALRLFGREIGREDHIKIYNGLPTTEKLKVMSEKGELPWGVHEIIKTLKRKYTDEQVFLNCKPNHEKQIMLSNLKRVGYKLAVVSNAQRYSVENMLRCSMTIDFFDYILGNDEGYKPKPAPDMYLAAFHFIKLKPREVVIVEDSPHGIEAAKRSGAKVLEVRGFEEVNSSLFYEEKLLK